MFFVIEVFWDWLITKSSNLQNFISGSSSFGRAVAFQASGGRFEPGLPLIENYELRIMSFLNL